MNSRITEILDHLAILNQSLQSVQESAKTIDILGEIKLLTAQLYLETDMEIIASNSPEEETVIEDQAEELLEEVPVFSFIKNDIIQEDLQNSQIEEVEILPEVVPHIHVTQTTIEIDNVPNEPEIEEPEITLEMAEVIANEVIEEVVPESTVTVNEIIMPPSVQENMRKAELSERANKIIGQFSLTRRYEFMNFLFGGDMNKFVVFVSEMLNAAAGESRETVYEKWYDENQWSRKYETAADLKKNIGKLL